MVRNWAEIGQGFWEQRGKWITRTRVSFCDDFRQTDRPDAGDIFDDLWGYRQILERLNTNAKTTLR